MVLIPKENVKDLEEIPDNVKAQLDIRAVENIDEVLALALQNPVEGVQVLTPTLATTEKVVVSDKKRGRKPQSSQIVN